MFGWRTRAIASASRWKRLTAAPSFPGRSVLSATTRWISPSQARQTTPIPPAPICESTRNRPKWRFGSALAASTSWRSAGDTSKEWLMPEGSSWEPDAALDRLEPGAGPRLLRERPEREPRSFPLASVEQALQVLELALGLVLLLGQGSRLLDPVERADVRVDAHAMELAVADLGAETGLGEARLDHRDEPERFPEERGVGTPDEPVGHGLVENAPRASERQGDEPRHGLERS